MKPLMIELVELTHCYNTHAAVDHVSLGIHAGKVLGLLGPNGAGKTTLIKMLTTLLPPTLGTAKIKDYDIVRDALQVRQHIGYVPRLLSTDKDLTGYENLLFSAKLYSLPPEKRKKRVHELLDFMELSEFAHQLVGQYSGGMIRRLEIAQALVHSPPVLFLDEPTAGLDPTGRRLLWQRIKELRKEFGTTILITTHDMDEADTLCDQIAFMHLGSILRLETPSNLKKEISPHATLEDVFMQLTGTCISEEGDFNHAQETRQIFSDLD